MEHQFWHDKWAKNEIGFHEGQPNRLLVKHFETLRLEKEARVLVPLCGKTADIPYLISKGCHVIGAELSEPAIKQLFEEMGVRPQIQSMGPLKHYSADNIDIYVGDIFDLTASMLGPVDAIFDRAALVALPPEMRIDYTSHLMEISGNARQLLITFEYDQSQMSPPPHSIPVLEIEDHYGATYERKELDVVDVAGGLKGKSKAMERATYLIPH